MGGVCIETVAEAKKNLSALIKRVEAGDVVIITRVGKPVAKMVQIAD